MAWLVVGFLEKKGHLGEVRRNRGRVCLVALGYFVFDLFPLCTVFGVWNDFWFVQCEQYLSTCTGDDPNRTSEWAFLLSCKPQFILVASIKNLNVNSDSGVMSSCRYYMMALS